MWKRGSAKLLSFGYVSRPNHIVSSSLWSSILRPSSTIVPRHYSVVYKRFREMWSGHGPVKREPEHLGGDLVDRDFLNGPFGTKESPAVMRSYYDAQVVGCRGPKDAIHDSEFFWVKNGETRVCPVCSQYFMLKCVGVGGYPRLNVYPC